MAWLDLGLFDIFLIDCWRKLVHCFGSDRIDASKHMWPADMTIILAQLRTLPTDHDFPIGAKPFVYQEVIDLGESIGRLTIF